MTPTVDINLFVHNGAGTVQAAIDSVLAQTWQDWRLTLIDDGSTDGTTDILRRCAERHPRIQLKRNRSNTGAVGAFQRGFWTGDADFLMPKSADDLIAPHFIERLMEVLLHHPACVMAHAGGLSFQGAGHVDFVYPEHHRLNAIGADPLSRAAEIMRHYTSAPSFWGIYRREAVDHLAPIAPIAGWDHVMLAELALYGEVRHTAEVLYWRRGTGRPVRDLARAATAESARAIALDTPIADPLWRTPYIATAFAHIENFRIARVPLWQQTQLIEVACEIFGARWRSPMLQELRSVRSHIREVVDAAADAGASVRHLAHLQLTRLLTAIALMVPGASLDQEHAALGRLLHGHVPCLA